jgi:hypothetical protein
MADQELLLRNEYLVTENHILRDQLKGRGAIPTFRSTCEKRGGPELKAK